MTVETDLALEDEALAERRLHFLSMRNAGATFAAIASRYNERQRAAYEAAGGDPDDAPKLSASTVRKDVLAAKERIIGDETREALIAEETSVILDVRRANYAAMLDGDIDAAKIVLSTVVQRREMRGLDEPKRSVVGVGTDVDFAGTLLDLIRAVPSVAKELEFTVGGRRDDILAIDSARIAPFAVPGNEQLEADEVNQIVDDFIDVWSNVDETSAATIHAETGDGE
jgi:hypothetical protein